MIHHLDYLAHQKKIKKTKYLKKYNNSYVLLVDQFAEFIKSGDMENISNKDEVIIKKYKELEKYTIIKRITSDNNLLGYACLYCEKRNKENIELFKTICNTLSYGFGLINIEEKTDNIIFKNILNEIYTSKEEIKSVLKNINLLNNDKKHVILIKSKNKNSFIKGLLNNTNEIAFIYNQYVVCISNKNKDEINKYFSEIIENFKDEKIIIGVSDEFVDLENLKQYYDQAKDAVSISIEFTSKNKVIFIEENRILSLLIKVDKEELLRALDPRVDKIIKYDYENNTDYYKSLDAYFQAGRNINKAASNLYVHKNSLYYRLEKIKELFNFDFENDSDCLLVELSIKVKKILKNNE